MKMDKEDSSALATYNNTQNLFQIQLDEGSVPDRVGKHTHEFIEIIYCRSNCGAKFQLDEYIYQLQRGDIILIPPQMPHAWLVCSKGGEPYRGHRICMYDEYISRIKLFLPIITIPNHPQANFIRTTGTIWEQFSDIFRVLYEETHFKPIGWESASLSGSIYFLTMLLRAVVYNPNAQVLSEKTDLVESVSTYVRAHMAEKITLEDIAQRFWVSPSTITHVFNKRLGVSFYKYVTSLRLGEAKNLITEGMPMEKIAIRVGFGDYSAFYRAFKKEFGLSPRQFHKSLDP